LSTLLKEVASEGSSCSLELILFSELAVTSRSLNTKHRYYSIIDTGDPVCCSFVLYLTGLGGMAGREPMISRLWYVFSERIT
jgi:hypothetical protein